MSTIPLPEKPTTGLDYEADEYIHAETPQQLKALGNQLRMSLLDLLNERAASITELADAVGRPKGTVGYHVKVLEDTGFVRVVRTRQVRAMTEKLYGRTAHTIIFHGSPDPGAKMFMLQEALAEAVVEDESALASSTLRHVRMSDEQADRFLGSGARAGCGVRQITARRRPGLRIPRLPSIRQICRYCLRMGRENDRGQGRRSSSAPTTGSCGRRASSPTSVTGSARLRIPGWRPPSPGTDS